jgi:thymidylate kinase
MATFERPPRCIHLAGADGSGKTTQARALIDRLAAQGTAARYVWLRFPRLSCTPFLVYARLRGYSRQETVDGQRYGYWDFGRSWVMRNLFPWALWVDTWLMALVRLYRPLWRGETVVCDRFVADVLVDLMLGLGEPCLDQRTVGRLFLWLLPREARTAVIDLETALAVERTPALRPDRTRSARRELYLGLAARQGWPVVSAADAPEVVTEKVIGALTRGGRPAAH